MTRAKKFSAAITSLGSLVVGTASSGTGWPGHVTIQTSRGPIPAALHVSEITTHSRKSYERRFQNPAACPPVVDANGKELPILLGLDDPSSPTVFVAADGRSRVGRTTRFSILFHDYIIDEARKKGWSMYQSTTGEKMYAFVPALFPAFIDQILSNEMLAPTQISEAAEAAGVLDPNLSPASMVLAATRASKAVNVLVRKAGTGKKIKAAYGHQCAMCSLGSNLLQGAHIYPVEAPGSTDDTWNGLSLCLNHHGAFDRHLIWVDPKTYEVRVHPSIAQESTSNAGTKHFFDSTHKKLIVPKAKKDIPLPKMFEERYKFFQDQYLWANKKP